MFVGFYAASFYYIIIPGAPLWEILLFGIISGLLILFSILLHELMHLLMARRYDLKVLEIELFIFGGECKIQEEPATPKTEMIIAVVGPISSLVLGAALLAVVFIPVRVPVFILVILLYSGISNIILGFFNLLPAFPMDGGRVLRAILWKRSGNLLSATKTASKIGTFFGFGLIGYGLFEILFLELIGGLWLIIIGLFLKSSAKRAYINTVYKVSLSNLNAREILGGPKIKCI